MRTGKQDQEELNSTLGITGCTGLKPGRCSFGAGGKLKKRIP